MGLYTLYGINGVGKDTVANSVQSNNPRIKITSLSRILMYSIGLTKSFDTSEKVGEQQYKILESISKRI